MSQHRNDPEPNGLDDRFADWVDGRLDEQARRELEAELARDAELRRQAEEYRATVQMVREHLTPHLTHDKPPADLVTGVLERVRRERSPLFRLVPLVASLSAAAALVLTVFLLNQPWKPGAEPRDDRNRGKEVAKYDMNDEEDQLDDMARKEPEAKGEAGKAKLGETLDRAPRFKRRADQRLAKKIEEMGEEQEQETQREQVGEQTAKTANKKVAVVDELRTVRAPGKTPAPAAPVEPGAGAEQQARASGSRDRMGGRGGLSDPAVQADKNMEDRDGIRPGQETQLSELRRITAQVFTTPRPVAEAAPTAPNSPAPRLPQTRTQTQTQTRTQTKTEAQDYDQGALAQKPRPDAEKKHKADDTKLAPQVPVVLVQLAAPRAPVGGKAESHKEGKEDKEGKGQQQVAQNFLGYLQQQPQSWAVGNEIRRQARTEDLTRRLARPEKDAARPQTGGGAATAQAVLRPGDQLLLVTGSSREVEALFQQLKIFFGKPKDVAVQQLSHPGLPGGIATFGARRHADQKQGQEMQFYLVLRDAPPAERPHAGRR